MKVLIVDDEADIRRIACLGLARLGSCDVVEAQSGAQALEQARQAQPDVILLDVMMPGQDGPTTLEVLRADPSTASIPVVFLTAKAMPSEIARLTALGAAGVLTKPFDPRTLADQVRARLARS